MMGALHDALEASGYKGHALERFLVRLLFCLFADDTGSTAIEYAILAAGIAGVLVAVVMSIGTSLNTMYTSVSNGFN